MIGDYLVRKQIPKEIMSYGYKILHLTDTPTVIYGFLRRVIRLVNPDVIIHTGDLVDNIKLEFSRSRIGNYERDVKACLSLMRQSNPDHIYIIRGNHDDEDIIRKYLKKDEQINERLVLQILNKSFALAHYSAGAQMEKVDFSLFGHSPEVMTDCSDYPILLNGLEAIYVIDGLTGAVSAIPYPKDTDDFRQRKSKLGL